jgi:hypothetical protein
MRIEEVTRLTANGSTRLSARLVWEDGERAADTLWYEWPASFESDVAPSTAALAVAALPLAMVNGERRVRAAEPVCALLREHLNDVAQLFATWYPELSAPRIDVEALRGATDPSAGVAAICLSGGVDSLAALVDNHTALHTGHRERIRAGIYVAGLNTHDFVDAERVPARFARHEAYVRQLGAYCHVAGLQLVPVATNIRSLYADWPTWERAGPAAALSAIGHAMPRVRALTIASAGNGVAVSRSGTEPLLDPLYSSYALSIRTAHAGVSRVDKVRMIAAQPAALSVLRVCLAHELPAEGTINCGRCEKCLRTMLALEACGVLEHTPTFPVRQIAPAMLEALDIGLARRAVHYRRVLEALRERGRDDLARVLERRLAEFERREPVAAKSFLHRLFRA